MRATRGNRYAADDVIMREGVNRFARVGIPDFAVHTDPRQIGYEMSRYSFHEKPWTHAVKSALPDAALEVSGDSLLDQTAPL